VRRGEGLALRWRDVDLDAGRIAVRRSPGVVQTRRQGQQLHVRLPSGRIVRQSLHERCVVGW
jgi:integrase